MCGSPKLVTMQSLLHDFKESRKGMESRGGLNFRNGLESRNAAGSRNGIETRNGIAFEQHGQGASIDRIGVSERREIQERIGI